MSQKEETEEIVEEPTPDLQTTKERISCQYERRDELPETSTATRRVSILFREITKQLRNRLLNGQVPEISESRDKEGQITMDPDTILQDILSQVHTGVYQTSDLCLDKNTAGNNVVVRGDLKSAYWTVEELCYIKSKKRFHDPQVLSINSFKSGQHFWVIETSKSGNWRIGMCYPSMARKGFYSYIGCNNKSWGLCKWNNEYSVMHNCKEIHLSPGLSCQKIGIFLDYIAGQLSFYELGNPVRLLHTYTATFTEPLHAVFRIWLDSLGSSWILIKD